MNLKKGLCDAVNEIGHATGDAVMQYSKVHHGEEYAETVMKVQAFETFVRVKFKGESFIHSSWQLKLDAAGHLSRAAYCGYYVATMGG